MKYTLTISTDDPTELASLLSGSEVETSTAQSTPGKNKAKTTKAVEQESEELEEEDLVGGEDGVTFESLQTKVSEKAQAGARDKVKKLLAKYKATKLTEVSEDDYAAFDKELDKIKV